MKHPRRIPSSGLSDHEAYRKTWTVGGLFAVVVISLVVLALLTAPKLVVAGIAGIATLKLLSVVTGRDGPNDGGGGSATRRVVR